jgi:hypothetical protein
MMPILIGLPAALAAELADGLAAAEAGAAAAGLDAAGFAEAGEAGGADEAGAAAPPPPQAASSSAMAGTKNLDSTFMGMASSLLIEGQHCIASV